MVPPILVLCRVLQHDPSIYPDKTGLKLRIKVQRCCNLRIVLGCGYAGQRVFWVEGLDTHGLVRVLDVQVTTHQRLLLTQSGAGGANGLAGEDRHCAGVDYEGC